jgi:Cu/Ag efflux protein CusF
MKRIFALPIALALTASAWAHNGMEHVMGTVAAITTSSLDVKAATGKVTTVGTDSKTMWMKGKAMITAKDIHTGDRVVIHAKKVDGKLIAAEVELGDAAAPAHTH